MRRTISFTCTFLLAIHAQPQDVRFDQGCWQTLDLDKQVVRKLVLANQERVDTAYTEDINTGEMTMVVQRTPLSRYEYDLHTDALFRRIEIEQATFSDTTFVENINTGELIQVVQVCVRDIPMGAYEEYYSGYRPHWRGQVNGLGKDGTLIKIGEWVEWDENGNVLQRLNY
jgi:hypothetical protein